MTTANTRPAIVFIDAHVCDLAHLLNGVRPGYPAFVLTPSQDGMNQISQILSTLPVAPREIHLIAHGAPGTLHLGNTTLSLETLDHYAPTLQTWFQNPKSQIPNPLSSLYLYGCNVAAGDAGAEFLTQLHTLTGANLAASTSRVGNAALGGTWHLDVAIGSPASPLALTASAQATYPGTLADPTNEGTILGGTRTIEEDGSFAFTGADKITVSEGALGATLNINLRVSNGGKLNLANTGGLVVTGNNTNSVTILGATEAQANTALASLSFAPPANIFGTFNFTIETVDIVNGGSDTDGVTFTVTAVNDPAVIAGDLTKNLTEVSAIAGQPNGAVSGKLTAVDPDVADPDNTFQVIDPTAPEGIGQYGTLALAINGQWTYTLTKELFQGQAVKDTFTVKSFDGTSATVTINLTGINDTATITDADTNFTLSTLIEDGLGTGQQIATITVDITDVDRASESVFTTQTNVSKTYGFFSVTKTGVVTYVLDNSRAAVQALAEAQQVTDTFTITSQDGTQQVITAKITGTNDLATITTVAGGTIVNPVGTVTENAVDNSETGTVKLTDPDTVASDFKTITAGDKEGAGVYGNFTLVNVPGTDNATWTYTLDNTDPDTQALRAGETVTDEFTIQSLDGTATAELVIKIVGVNDAPTISGQIVVTGTENSTDLAPPNPINLLANASDAEDPVSALGVNNLLKVSGNAVGISGSTPGTPPTTTSKELNVDLDAYDYLAAGATETIIYSYTVQDTDTAVNTNGSVKITVTGKNDPAEITGDFEGTVVEAGVAGAGTPTDTGVVTVVAGH
jgi:VCBS repeat-containing protein